MCVFIIEPWILNLYIYYYIYDKKTFINLFTFFNKVVQIFSKQKHYRNWTFFCSINIENFFSRSKSKFFFFEIRFSSHLFFSWTKTRPFLVFCWSWFRIALGHLVKALEKILDNYFVLFLALLLKKVVIIALGCLVNALKTILNILFCFSHYFSKMGLESL